jgi:hypothetical protein
MAEAGMVRYGMAGMVWLRLFGAGVSPQSPGFNPGAGFFIRAAKYQPLHI